MRLNFPLIATKPEEKISKSHQTPFGTNFAQNVNFPETGKIHRNSFWPNWLVAFDVVVCEIGLNFLLISHS